MAKIGGTKHLKRIAVPKAIPITNKKEKTWIINHSPGPHSKRSSIPLAVLMREILGFAKTAREVKKILNARLVQVDGKVVVEPAYPVGLFDVIHFSKLEKSYQINVDGKARLTPVEVASKSDKKILKVLGKNVLPKAKVNLSLHDGKNIFADNHVKVGDSVMLNLKDKKIEKILKLEKGATCLIIEGKHAGTVAKLEGIIERKEGKPSEAKLSYKDGEFITVAKYLFVVDDHFVGVSHE